MKIGVLGHFGANKEFFDGQTIKTRYLYELLDSVNEFKCDKVDTYCWRKHPFKLVHNIKNMFKNDDVIIMLPAHAGVKIFTPLLMHFKRKYHKRIIYSVIGGWLPKMLCNNNYLKKNLIKFDNIWVETAKMKTFLNELSFRNVEIVPNFKKLSPSKKNIEQNFTIKNYCIFSRVMEEKGIGLAINAISEINKSYGRVVNRLDIYGAIEENYINKFNELLELNKDCVKYCGCVPPGNSVKVLQNYYALIFPTKFYTEGVPGTIIDAMFAKLPIISSKWESCYDVIDDSMAIIYDFNDYKQLTASIKILNNVSLSKYIEFCENSYNKAKKYTLENVRSIIVRILGE